MSCSPYYTTLNAVPMPRVKRFRKAHSFWRDFCRPTYAVYACQCANPSKVATESGHPSILSPS